MNMASSTKQFDLYNLLLNKFKLSEAETKQFIEAIEEIKDQDQLLTQKDKTDLIDRINGIENRLSNKLYAMTAFIVAVITVLKFIK